MKKFLIFCLFFSLLFTNQTTILNAQNSNESVPQRIQYRIFDSNDNLVSTGFLPLSEVEANSKYSGYAPVTLSNGEYMALYNETDNCFTVGGGGRVTLMFGLNTNGYAKVQLFNLNNNNEVLNSWQGYTGGFSFSATTKTYSYIYGKITNIGSNTFTVNWASVEISY